MTQRRKQRNLYPVVVAVLIFLIIVTAALLYLKQKYSLSDERADLNAYFGLTGETDTALIIDETILPSGSAKTLDGTVYLTLDTIQQGISSRYYYDQQNGLLLYTLPTETVRVAAGEMSYSEAEEVIPLEYAPLRIEDGTPYVALPFLQRYTNLDYQTFEEPSRVQVTMAWGDKSMAATTQDTQLRELGGVKSPILTDLPLGTSVEVLEIGDPWTKVHTEDGFTGYVQQKLLGDVTIQSVTRDFVAPEYTRIKRDHKISMVWNQVTNQTSNGFLTESLANVKGVNTIAPTWFFISNTNGDIYSIVSDEYIQTAHSLGLEVWATFNDFDGEAIVGGPNSSEATLALLSNTNTRNHMVEQVMSEVIEHGIDGLNIDFEKVSEECDIHFEQFLRELSMQCRRNGIVLSVDNYVPTFTPQYNRREEGAVVDYLVIMGYDEHGPWSHEVGSVASLGYVRQGVEDTIEAGVPADKIVLGIPFYTRLWEETEQAGNSFSFTCEIKSMAEATQAVQAAGATIEWREEDGQNYATWLPENSASAYRIWLEDAQSIDRKLALVDEYGLAGWSAWKLGYETPDVWNVIEGHLQ